MANAHSISKRRTSNAHSNSMRGKQRAPDVVINVGGEADMQSSRNQVIGRQQTPSPQLNQLAGRRRR